MDSRLLLFSCFADSLLRTCGSAASDSLLPTRESAAAFIGPRLGMPPMLCTCGCSATVNGKSNDVCFSFDGAGTEAATFSTAPIDFPATAPRSESLSNNFKFSACKLASSRSWVIWTFVKDALTCSCRDFTDMGSISCEVLAFWLPKLGLGLHACDPGHIQSCSCANGAVGRAAFSTSLEMSEHSTRWKSENFCSRRAKQALIYFLNSIMSRTFAPWSPRKSSMTFMNSLTVNCFSPTCPSSGVGSKIVSAKSNSPMTSTPTS
mmetsp:Transcript_42310/g.83753  ORF Transcript_42310/g.83753 Transcript_42310/m.83753 type:complete len:263 (-) Transcript_42310:16-804(-)